MRCPTCKSPLKQDVVDHSGRRFDYCRGCGAQWHDQVSSASAHSATAARRAASVDRYEQKLGRRSFATEYRYRIGRAVP